MASMNRHIYTCPHKHMNTTYKCTYRGKGYKKNQNKDPTVK